MRADERIKYLVQNYLNKTISKEEYKELSEWIVQSDFKEVESVFETYIHRQKDWGNESEEFAENQVLKQIQSKINQSNKRAFPYISWTYYAAVAGILVFGFILLKPWKNKGFISPEKISDKTVPIRQVCEDIDLLANTGGHLSFADGEVINISQQATAFMDYDSIRYRFLANGGVRLEPLDSVHPDHSKHTFFTNKGDKANIVLEDGTSVWLSSSSSLVFPATFATDKRVVEVKGEAFFDVSHNPDKPFIVKTNKTEIEVLGTRFNMCAYPESDFSTTTLFSGSVQVKSKSNQQKIVPGQQIIVKSDGELAIADVNLHEVISWQSDVYRFSNLTIEEILFELGRWYGIEGIDNQSALHDRYTGVLSKSKKLSEILRELETISAHRLIIQERRILIMD